MIVFDNLSDLYNAGLLIISDEYGIQSLILLVWLMEDKPELIRLSFRSLGLWVFIFVLLIDWNNLLLIDWLDLFNLQVSDDFFQSSNLIEQLWLLMGKFGLDLCDLVYLMLNRLFLA